MALGKLHPLSASSVFKAGIINAVPTPQVIAKSTPAFGKCKTPCRCSINICSCPLSRAALSQFIGRAMNWAAVPFKYTSYRFETNGAGGGDGWELQWCGGEYGFTKIAFGGSYGSNGSEPQSAASHPQR